MKIYSFLNKYFNLLLILPAFLTLTLLVGWPIIYTIYLSFNKWIISSKTIPNYVGLKNYIDTFTDQQFYDSLQITIYFTFGGLAIQLVLGVSIAQLLNRKFIGESIFRSILILPIASTPVVIALVWRLMLHPTLGIINYILNFLNIGGEPWLSQYNTVILTLIVIDTWHWTPLIVLITLAGMTSIDKQLYEAAKIDGANSFQLFRHITLPLIRHIVIIAVLLRFMDSIKTFDMIYVTTEGGPGTASRILNLFIFDQGLRYFKMGYSSANVVILTLLVMVTCFFMIYFRKKS